jgi:tellurite resistance protein
MTLHLTREQGQALLSSKPKRSKYGAKRTLLDGIVFDSKREAEVYGQLKLLEKAGRISGFERQRKFNLIVNSEIIGSYRADFAFIDHDQDGRLRVVDVKGVVTRDFRRVQKIIKAAYNIEVEIWK